MIALALQNNADPAVLGRLMDLQERWDAQQARKEFVLAMTEFKREVPAVLNKDGEVDFVNKVGQRTNYRHATLGGIINQITAALSKHGLSASWETSQGKDYVTVTCHVTHSAGHRESVTLCGPPDDSGGKNKIQQIGSSVTYLQRYTLLAALGLATAEQDDDARGGRAPVTMPKAKPPSTGKPQAKAEPEPTPLGDEVTVGVAVAKTGKKGKHYWLRADDGEFYSTFDTGMGQDVLGLAEGDEVVVTYTVSTGKDGKEYRNLISLGLAGDAREPEQDDDEPVADGEQDEIRF